MKKILKVLALVLTGLCISCGDKGVTRENEILADSLDIASEESLDEVTQYKYDYVISNIPIPFEILDKLFRTRVSYNETFLNPIANENKYLQANSKALNLGVYGADLTYVISFEKFNQISSYLKNSKKLADDLGIPLAFTNESLTRFEKNRTDKDSLENMLYDSYNNVDKTLRSNERISLAALVVTGGWLEGLYITLKTLEESPDEKNKELHNIIWQQNFHLINIIDLLKEFNNEKYFITLIDRLQEIKRLYDFMDKKNITKTEVAALTEKVTALRNTITEAVEF